MPVKRDPEAAGQAAHFLAKHTGQPYEKIAHDTGRDFYMSAEQALGYGVVDEILVRAKALAAKY